MKSENIYLRVLGIIIKLAVVAFVALFLIRISGKAYNFGYSIFAQKPISKGEGKKISVNISKGDSVKKIGKMLKDNGLIEDELLFIVQEKLSVHHGKILPGTYELSTSMTCEQMLEVMSEDEEGKALKKSVEDGTDSQNTEEDGTGTKDTKEDNTKPIEDNAP